MQQTMTEGRERHSAMRKANERGAIAGVMHPEYQQYTPPEEDL
jgi:hypothetical protein